MQPSQHLVVHVQTMVNDRMYLFSMPYGVPIQEAIDAFNAIGKEMDRSFQDAIAAQKKAEEEKNATHSSNGIAAELVA